MENVKVYKKIMKILLFQENYHREDIRVQNLLKKGFFI